MHYSTSGLGQQLGLTRTVDGRAKQKWWTRIIKVGFAGAHDKFGIWTTFETQGGTKTKIPIHIMNDFLLLFMVNEFWSCWYFHGHFWILLTFGLKLPVSSYLHLLNKILFYILGMFHLSSHAALLGHLFLGQESHQKNRLFITCVAMKKAQSKSKTLKPKNQTFINNQNCHGIKSYSPTILGLKTILNRATHSKIRQNI